MEGSVEDIGGVIDNAVPGSAEETLRERQRLLSMVLDNSRDALNLLDLRVGNGGALFVLLIEDDVFLQEITVEVLRLLGHKTTTASDGPAGIAAARACRPDVILCDIGLPGMNGYDVARTIRADDTLRSVPLVALTGYALATDVEAAKEAGFDAHIAKPVDPAVVDEVLAALTHS